MTNPPEPDARPATAPSPVADVLAKIRDMGGARHLVDGAAPILGYIAGLQLSGILAGIGVAILTALVIAALRVRHGDRPKIVAASTALVLVFSAMAAATGEGRDFFLPPLILYSALTVAFLVSQFTATPLTLPICRRIRFEPAEHPDPAARIRLHRRLTLAWDDLLPRPRADHGTGLSRRQCRAAGYPGADPEQTDAHRGVRGHLGLGAPDGRMTRRATVRR